MSYSSVLQRLTLRGLIFLRASGPDRGGGVDVIEVGLIGENRRAAGLCFFAREKPSPLPAIMLSNHEKKMDVYFPTVATHPAFFKTSCNADSVLMPFA